MPRTLSHYNQTPKNLLTQISILYIFSSFPPYFSLNTFYSHLQQTKLMKKDILENAKWSLRTMISPVSRLHLTEKRLDNNDDDDDDNDDDIMYCGFKIMHGHFRAGAIDI